MTYFSLLLVSNLVLMLLAIFIAKQINQNLQQRDITKYVGEFELLWSVFCILLALYITFDVIENSGNRAFLASAGGTTRTLLTLLYAFGIFHFIFSCILIYKVFRTNNT